MRIMLGLKPVGPIRAQLAAKARAAAARKAAAKKKAVPPPLGVPVEAARYVRTS
jgi:hypothetical protein